MAWNVQFNYKILLKLAGNEKFYPKLAGIVKFHQTWRQLKNFTQQVWIKNFTKIGRNSINIDQNYKFPLKLVRDQKVSPTGRNYKIQLKPVGITKFDQNWQELYNFRKIIWNHKIPPKLTKILKFRQNLPRIIQFRQNWMEFENST